MSDILLDDDNDNYNNELPVRVSRPSLAQVKAIISFMEQHPDLPQGRLRVGVGHAKFKKLWVELSNIANSINGATKTTKGWIKFWSDKRRSIIMKQHQIEHGKMKGRLTPLEIKVLDLCGDNSLKSSKKTTEQSEEKSSRKKRAVKQEPCNSEDDEDSCDEVLSKDGDSTTDNSRLFPTEAEERQFNMIDKLVEVMDQQATALMQMAQASQNNSKALERVAEAAHVQALAVDRLSGTFENISASVLDVRNAILGIDYTMKRCYPTTATQQRQNSNIFS